MRRALEIFTENKWISDSRLGPGDHDLLLTPTLQGLEDAPKLMSLLQAIDDDPTGETAACAIVLLRIMMATDNYLETDDEKKG